MPKPVKIIMALALLLGGMDVARDYFGGAGTPETAGGFGEIISFWSFVAVIVAIGGFLAYRRFRSRRDD